MEPITLAVIFASVSGQFGLPTGLLSAVCFTESNHKVYAINKDDGKGGASLGVCQMKRATAQTIGFRGDQDFLMRPSVNIYYAAKYLSQQLKRYKGDPVKAICAYNTGTYKENANKQPVNLPYMNKVLKAWLKNK